MTYECAGYGMDEDGLLGGIRQDLWADDEWWGSRRASKCRLTWCWGCVGGGETGWCVRGESMCGVPLLMGDNADIVDCRQAAHDQPPRTENGCAYLQ